MLYDLQDLRRGNRAAMGLFRVLTITRVVLLAQNVLTGPDLTHGHLTMGHAGTYPATFRQHSGKYPACHRRVIGDIGVSHA